MMAEQPPYNVRNLPEFTRLYEMARTGFAASYINTPEQFEQFIFDPAYRDQVIQLARQNTRENRPGNWGEHLKLEQEFLNQFTGFATTAQQNRANPPPSTFEQSGGAIDVEAIFGPLRQEIDRLTQTTMQAGRSAITRGAQQAEEFASESLAGTGLGRSGIGAGTFARIGQSTAGKLEASDTAAVQRGEEAKLRVSQQIDALKYSEELRERGFNEEDIRTATNFVRQMELMRFQSSLEIAANEPTWWEEWGPLFEIVGSITGAALA